MISTETIIKRRGGYVAVERPTKPAPEAYKDTK
jgi:hypothetical protein